MSFIKIVSSQTSLDFPLELGWSWQELVRLQFPDDSQ